MLDSMRSDNFSRVRVELCDIAGQQYHEVSTDTADVI